MSRIQHKNFVKFYGFCYEANLKALVFAYVGFGSLDKILYENSLDIEWAKLYDIVIETAKGLCYLHEGYREPLTHHDFRTCKVLLDSNLSPKIVYDGFAELYNFDTSRIINRGFAAPEAVMNVRNITHKSNVFSFGILMFEVLKRKHNTEDQEWFPEQVWEKFVKGKLDEIIMDCCIQQKDKEKAKTLSTAALWCVQYKPQDRPEMSYVVKLLQGEIQPLSPPNPFPYL